MEGLLFMVVILAASVNAKNGGTATNFSQSALETDKSPNGYVSRHELEQLLNGATANLKHALKEVQERLATAENELGKCVDFKNKFENYSLNENAKVMNARMPSSAFQRAILPELNVEFSAYLDHDVDTLGKGQTIIFNRVITNNGNAYNAYSGTFTTPRKGVYAFHFSIRIKANPDAYLEFWAQLKRNAENIIDSTAEVRIIGEDQQASNFVILQLNQGDIVNVAELYGSKLRGSPSLRGTNFSGFIIREEE